MSPTCHPAVTPRALRRPTRRRTVAPGTPAFAFGAMRGGPESRSVRDELQKVECGDHAGRDGSRQPSDGGRANRPAQPGRAHLPDIGGPPLGLEGLDRRGHGDPQRCRHRCRLDQLLGDDRSDALRIVRVPASGHHHDTLGESLLDPVRRTGTLATIYVDRVEWLAAAGGVEAGILMARAIAHELGHLLLGTTAHSRRGLMRRVWSRDELIRARAADWRFPAEDATRLQQALDRRPTTLNAQLPKPKDQFDSEARLRESRRLAIANRWEVGIGSWEFAEPR
jgi:hypothetical protein